ncbi:MAG: transketolase family protein [Thermodesulfovibrionales bacterium]|nr:transketolase family protein [Thermodesulfovibrionales bacterium]
MANRPEEALLNKELTFDDEINSLVGKDMATRDAYGMALYHLGITNEKIVVLDADLSCSTKTIKFAKTFPERFFNVGISEQDMVCTAGGLSLSGLIPFASTFAIFETGRAWEQIRQTIAYPCLNVKLAATHAGITVGEDGASHQANEDIALMRVIPNMTIIVPADGFETAQFVSLSAEHDGPIYIRLGRAKAKAVMPQDYKAKIGKAYRFHIGKDVCIIATGLMVYEALKARDELLTEGIDCGVVNVSTIKPLDTETILDSIKNCKLVVTAEEHSIIGGLGGAIAELVSEHFPIKVIRIGVQDTFGMSGSPAELMKNFGLTSDNIIANIKKNIV